MNGPPSTAPQVDVAMDSFSARDAKVATDAAQIERIASPDDFKNGADYGRIDPEVAKYTTGERVEISEAESRRLRRLIDRRVLPIMVRSMDDDQMVRRR